MTGRAPRLVLLGAALAAMAALLAACSAGGPSASPPSAPATSAPEGLAVELIDDAVAAVEGRLGGPQRYTEINAIPTGVNVFVARGDDEEEAWFYDRSGSLQAPADPAPRSHEPFTLEGVDVAAGPRLVADVEGRLPGARVVTVALVVVPDQGLAWALQSRSPRGGLLNVLFSPQGQLVAVYPAPEGSGP